MSFPRYRAYKASGVDWLAKVPADWVVTKTKHVTRFTTGWTPPTGDAASFEGENLWANISDLGPRTISTTAKRISDEAIRLSRIKPSPKGSLLFSFKLSIGRVSFAGEQMFTNEAIATFSSSRSLNLDYAYYAFPILLVQNAAENIYGARLLNQELIRAASFALPTVSEQARIAAFLDRETSKIDALVAEQRSLMELLNEKRQAVISHAVTKGLNPDAPMKPSGIEWLGAMPGNWRAVPFKHLARPGAKTFTDGDWIEAPYITSEGVRLIQTGNIGIGHYKEQGFRYVSEQTFRDLGCTEVMPRDILVCRLDGPVGRACLAPDLGARMITSVDNAILKAAHGVVPEFVVAILSSVPWISWIDALCRVGGGFRLRISRGQLGELRIPLPPYEEQLAIASYLRGETDKAEELEAEAERAIGLLLERRAALISAAVTGQIDVRGFVEAA